MFGAFEAPGFRACATTDAIPKKSCPLCRSIDATGTGICEAIAGYKLEGTICVAINCRCEGTECPRIYATELECREAARACSQM